MLANNIFGSFYDHLIIQFDFLSKSALKKLNKRAFIINRSSFVGLGHYSGHWDGDVNSRWDTMKWTIACNMNSM